MATQPEKITVRQAVKMGSLALQNIAGTGTGDEMATAAAILSRLAARIPEPPLNLKQVRRIVEPGPGRRVRYEVIENG